MAGPPLFFRILNKGVAEGPNWALGPRLLEKMSGSGGGSGRFRIPTIWLDEQIPQGFSKKVGGSGGGSGRFRIHATWAIVHIPLGFSKKVWLRRRFRAVQGTYQLSGCANSPRLFQTMNGSCCREFMRPGGAGSQSWRKALDMVSGWGSWRGANTAAGSEHVHTLTPRDSQCTHHTSHPPSNVSP